MHQIILGIESSCDDTAAAIYDSQLGIVANQVSSHTIHANYGGVVPELASREHAGRVMSVIDNCLEESKLSISDITTIAYTAGPGLAGSLLVGATVANTLAFSYKLPVIPVNHLEGHILTPFGLPNATLPLPFIALIVSGGHTQLFLSPKLGSYALLGETLDDAAGEVFDKAAKMLGLPYPGGKALSLLAKDGEDQYHLPRPMLHSKNLNMSFSGLKTAIAVLIKKLANTISDTNILSNVAKSIESAIVDTLVYKSLMALKQYSVNNLVVVGGVSANSSLRTSLAAAIPQNCNVFFAPVPLCTDNGAMIAIAANYRGEQTYNYDFTINPTWKLHNA